MFTQPWPFLLQKDMTMLVAAAMEVVVAAAAVPQLATAAAAEGEGNGGTKRTGISVLYLPPSTLAPTDVPTLAAPKAPITSTSIMEEPEQEEEEPKESEFYNEDKD
ncbi:hypothetical protein GUJ93_ZPchr0004g39620 [Zizania palustris]|uniref:Secreted protein n=1 Tax=Zizania palustris TaxID=103762 RepID=A0A8J5SXG5_ZIZPA|nr:hypothetical protein GUJ93_ZPchr0004g39620 [Zizania palustris]